MTTSKPKRIIMLNASALKLSSCRRRLYFTIVEGFRPALNRQAMEWGSAFHLTPKGVEEHGNIGRATQESIKYWKECRYIPDKKKAFLDESLLGKTCLNWYMESYMKDSFSVLRDTNNLSEKCSCLVSKESIEEHCPICSDMGLILYPTGKPMVEIKFTIPYYEDENVIILLFGTIDKVSEHRTSRLIAVGDYKTTSMWNEEEYLAMYELNCQLFVYTLALKTMIDNCDEKSILWKYKGKQIGAYIDGVFMKGKEALNASFKRSEVFIFKQGEMDEFKMLLDEKCRTISHMCSNPNGSGLYVYKEGLINDSCTTKFGPCAFANVCKAPDSITANHVLKRNFIQKPYDPAHL